MSWSQKDALALDSVWGDAYGGSWVKRRALRTRGVFHKLEPPPLGCALTMRHLYPIEEADTVVTRSDYAYSVYNAWMGLHRTTVESWYERHVVRD